MIQVRDFDDSTWKNKIATYRQAVAAQAATKPALPLVTPHTPYPYERMIYTTRHISPAKTPIAGYQIVRRGKPIQLQADDIYYGIHQITRVTRKLRQSAAALWADKWLDPFTYFDEAETPYTKAGGIDIDRAIMMAWGVLRAIGRVETESLINLYDRALQANAKVIYLPPVPTETAVPANVITLPLVELSRHPRTCAWCGTKTSSGIRALCDQHHHRYIVSGDFRNSPINYDDLARLIIQSDSRHRQNVMEARVLKAG
jgi:hypothetical protein